jgi:hypothetical protein
MNAAPLPPEGGEGVLNLEGIFSLTKFGMFIFGFQGIIKKLLCNHNTKNNTNVKPFLYKKSIEECKKILIIGVRSEE